jgi:ABC-type bacteriocin/lantibiotic exporter with double-glycine peptidase domain
MQYIALAVAVLCGAADGKPLSECGVSAMCVCLNELGVEVPIEQVRTEFLSLAPQPNLESLSLAELRRVAEKHGFRARSIKVPLTAPSLSALPMPCIVHIDTRARDRSNAARAGSSGHYVVLHSFDAKRNAVYVSDTSVPLIRRELVADRFTRFATGNMLIFERVDPIAWWLKLALLPSAGLLGLAIVRYRRPHPVPSVSLHGDVG